MVKSYLKHIAKKQEKEKRNEYLEKLYPDVRDYFKGTAWGDNDKYWEFRK